MALRRMLELDLDSPQLLWGLFGLLLGLVVSLIYFCLYRHLHGKFIQKQETIAYLLDIRGRYGSFVESKIPADSGRRESSMILMGTIFLTGAFILLGAASQAPPASLSRKMLAMIELLTNVWWLFSIQLSTRIMNDVEFELRLRERNVGYHLIQRYLYGGQHGDNWLIRIRRNHWLVYMVFVFMAAFTIMSESN